jgi:hypothetical protein
VHVQRAEARRQVALLRGLDRLAFEERHVVREQRRSRARAAG